MEGMYFLLAAAMGGVFFIVLLLILLQARTQNKILLQKKKLAEKEIAHQLALARALITSQERERKRIGMDMHDEVGTVLAALRMHVEKMKDAGGEQLTLLADAGKRSIDNVIGSVRRISHNLSPLIKGENGLKNSIEDIADDINKLGIISMSLSFEDPDQLTRLTEEQQLAVYRIITELVNNTVKHAGASEIVLVFTGIDDLLRIKYTDNGVGINNDETKNKGMGMSNIESRCNAMNAACSLDRVRKEGFAIEIVIPLNT